MLDTIIHHQRQQIPFFIDQAKTCRLVPSQKSLVSALSQPKRGFIFECKKASPSKGNMIHNYQPVELAQSLAPFASAISILTNSRFFQGSFQHLASIRPHVDCPILCKDIIVTKEQLYLARHFGADAVLLMLSVLDDSTYLSCKQVADRLGLDIITEIHDEDELDRALNLKANIIGINHRNFKTMRVDFKPTFALAPKIPNTVKVIAESGIECFDDLSKLTPYAKNFLIGSSISQSTRPDLKVRSLLYNEIKVCGLTRKQDALDAYELGASYGGLNFVPQSKRMINPDHARDLLEVPLQWVGVFQDHPIEEVVQISTALDLAGVQLHGHESVEAIMTLRQRLPQDIKIFKAVRLQDQERYDIPAIDRCILDSEHQGQFGGTGQTVDISKIPASIMPKRMLAGGLSAANITQVLNLPFCGFDINSGVESAPGYKSRDKLIQFFQAFEDASMKRRQIHA